MNTGVGGGGFTDGALVRMEFLSGNTPLLVKVLGVTDLEARGLEAKCLEAGRGATFCGVLGTKKRGEHN